MADETVIKKRIAVIYMYLEKNLNMYITCALEWDADPLGDI